MLKKIILILMSIGISAVLQTALFADINDDLKDAILKNNLKGVQSALDKGADPKNTYDKLGNSAIHMACYKGNLEIIKLLIAKGENVHAVSGFNNYTTLLLSAEGGHLEAFKFFLEKGVNINSKSTGKQTVLMYAANSGNAALVKFIVEKGVDINSQDSGGWTALMHAASLGKTDAVSMLINLKANLNIKGTSKFSRSGKDFTGDFSHGDTALSIAREAGWHQAAKILENAGAISYIDKFYNKNYLKEKLGYYDVEIIKANRNDLDDAIKHLKAIIKQDDPKRDAKLKSYENIRFEEGLWFIVRIKFSNDPGRDAFNFTLTDSKGKNLLRGSSSYGQTTRRGNIIVSYKDIILIRSVEPITKNIITKDRSPVSLTVTLLKTSKYVMKFYPELE